MKVQSFLEADFCYLDETKTDLETLDMYLALDIVLHIDSKDTIYHYRYLWMDHRNRS